MSAWGPQIILTIRASAASQLDEVAGALTWRFIRSWGMSMTAECIECITASCDTTDYLVFCNCKGLGEGLNCFEEGTHSDGVPYSHTLRTSAKLPENG